MQPDFYSAFLTYQYPELKELTLAFLTLVSSVFTFSVIFAEKLTKDEGDRSRGLFVLCMAWAFFLAAIVMGGVGLSHIFYLGDIAKGNPIFNLGYEPNVFLVKTSMELFTAGALFVIGMALLACTAFLRFTSLAPLRIDLGLLLAAKERLFKTKKS